jgi:hypothetical protein
LNEVNEIARRLHVISVADAPHHPRPGSQLALSGVDLFWKYDVEYLLVSGSHDVQGFAKIAVLPDATAQEVHQISLAPHDIELARIDVRQVNESAGSDPTRLRTQFPFAPARRDRIQAPWLIGAG